MPPLIGDQAAIAARRRRRLYGVGAWISAAILCLTVSLAHEREHREESPEADEISVSFIIGNLGATEIPALIRGPEVYLSIADVFAYLKIRVIESRERDSVYGFFITPQATFLVDRKLNRIVYRDEVVDLKPDDLIRTESGLYLRSRYFGEIFGLECAFSFQNLSVTLRTAIELPVVREMRLSAMRRNADLLKGETRTDTVIGRSYPLAHFGMADWFASSVQQSTGGNASRLALSLGGILAGGGAKVVLNAYSHQPFLGSQQYYLWKYANNEPAYLRQVMAGKINSQATSTLYSPVVGAQITNTPTTFRRSFGSYTLSDYTEPDWTVELYVNGILVQYRKADASGFFSFDVPLVYGNSDVKLRFYGPWGEERETEQHVAIPYTFLPPAEFEYTLGGGAVENGAHDFYYRGSVNYGVERHLTVGGGLEYLSSVTSGRYMPFINTSLSLSSSLLLSAEYMRGVRSRGILSYRFASSALLELNYSVYDKHQTAISNNYAEDRRIAVSAPFHIGKFVLYTRLDIDQIVLPSLKYTMADWMLAGTLWGVGANVTTHATFFDPSVPYVYSNVAMSFRLPGEYVVRPQTQYDYNQSRFVFMKTELEKNLFGKGFVTLTHEKYFGSDIHSLAVGLRYELPFAQTNASARRDGSVTTYSQSASGSLIVDAETGLLGAHNQTAVGRGGIAVAPFLDLNCNGKRDPDEPRASGLNLRTNGGRLVRDDEDTLIYIFDLEPYTTHVLEFDRNGFDNISWQIQHPVVGVAIDPNRIKTVEIPVMVVGEASGTISYADRSQEIGLGRITVCIFDSASSLVARVLTESDGYFSYLGLVPGSYTARIDTAQLRKLRMSAAPAGSRFRIVPARDGSVVDTLKFTLHSEDPMSTLNQHAPSETTFTRQPETAGNFYAIQIGVFVDRISAELLARKAKRLSGYDTWITHGATGSYYTCFVGQFVERGQAVKCALELSSRSFDFHEACIVRTTDTIE